MTLHRWQSKLIFWRSRACLVLCGVTGLLLLTPLAATGNLIENGSFEMFANGKFDGWSVAPFPDPEGITEIGKVWQDTEAVAEGSASSARFEFKGAGVYHVALKDPTSVTPAGKCRLTVHAKSEGGPVSVEIRLRLLNSDSWPPKLSRRFPLDFQTSEKWEKQTIEVDVADTEPLAGIQIVLRNTGSQPVTVWLDELMLEAL